MSGFNSDFPTHLRFGFVSLSGLIPVHSPCRSFGCLHPDAAVTRPSLGCPIVVLGHHQPHCQASAQLGLVLVREVSLYSPHLKDQKILDNRYCFCQKGSYFSLHQQFMKIRDINYKAYTSVFSSIFFIKSLESMYRELGKSFSSVWGLRPSFVHARTRCGGVPPLFCSPLPPRCPHPTGTLSDGPQTLDTDSTGLVFVHELSSNTYDTLIDMSFIMWQYGGHTCYKIYLNTFVKGGWDHFGEPITCVYVRKK